MAVYDLKNKLTRNGQNPDILAIADALDFTMNRLINLHNAIQVFDDQMHIRLGEAEISLYRDGQVHVTGKNITFISDDDFSVKAGADIRLKGARIIQR